MLRLRLVAIVLLLDPCSTALAGDGPEAAPSPASPSSLVSTESIDSRDAVAVVEAGTVRLLVERRARGFDLKARSGQPTLTTISGILFSADGYVLTVGDAFLDADLVSAETEDGEITLCDVIGYDPQTSIGVAQLRAVHAKPAALAPAAELAPGLPVFSVGNPFGLGTTVSIGHVTGLDRTIDVRGYEWTDLLQVSMAVNPGDQGGPIADREGRVVGMMLTRYLGEPDVATQVVPQGISFGLPIGKASRIAWSLIEAYKLREIPVEGEAPWVGVRVSAIEDKVLQTQLQLKPDQGILVDQVFQGSPAKTAGVMSHDVVLEIKAQPVRGLQHFGGLVRSLEVGEHVTLVILRRGERQTLELVVGAR